jgi:hypothetical protein
LNVRAAQGEKLDCESWGRGRFVISAADLLQPEPAEGMNLEEKKKNSHALR